MEGKEDIEKGDRLDQQSSIKISRNAKGDFAWEVKVYHDNPVEVEMKLTRYIAIAGGAVGARLAVEGRAGGD